MVMSDSSEHSASHPAATSAVLFTAVEIEQFEADDIVAGKAIGKMLSVLFLYTVLAMGLVTWWTYSVSGSNSSELAPTAEH